METPNNPPLNPNPNDDQNPKGGASNAFDLGLFNNPENDLQPPPQFDETSLDETQEESSFNHNQMAAMFGLNDSPSGEAIETTADVAGFEDSPPEDAVESRTQRAFKNKPLAKVGLIGGGTFVIFLVVATFLNSVFGGGRGQQIAQPESPKDEAINSLKGGDKEKEGLLEELASQKLREDARKREEEKVALAREEALRKREKELEALRAAAARKNKQIAPEPEPAPARPVIRSRTPVATNTRSLAPRPIRSVPPPPAPPRALPSRPAPSPIAPEVAWADAAKVGSFGVEEISGSRRTSSRNSSRGNTSRNEEPTAIAINPDEEGAVFNDGPTAPPKTLSLGTRVSGTLTTPISWDDTQAQGRQPANERFIVTLDEDLYATDDTVAIPRGTQLIGQLNSYTPSGLIDAEMTAVITQAGQRQVERNLPAGVISISGRGGRPLVAKSKRANTNGGNPFLEFVGQTILGAGRGIAREINSQATTITTNGTTTSVDTDDDVNVLGGALEGSSDSLLNLFEGRRRSRGLAASRSPAVRYWFAKAGSRVEIVVNRSAPIYGIFASR